MKPALTVWPLGSALLYYHSAWLCFDLFKPSLKVACSSVCGLQRLCRSSWRSERTSSLHSDLQSYCTKRTVFITGLHTTLLFLLHGKHTVALPPTRGLLRSALLRLFRYDWLELWLKWKLSVWHLLWEVQMAFRGRWKFNQSVMCLCWPRWSTGPSWYRSSLKI